MSTATDNLILSWEKRPTRVEPDNEDHLRYLFTELLPALREAIPDILRHASMVKGFEASQAARLQGLDLGSQSSVIPPGPMQGPSNHNQAVTQYMGGNDAKMGQTEGTGGKPASEPAMPALKPWQKAIAAKQAKASAKKVASVPPPERLETDAAGTV